MKMRINRELVDRMMAMSPIGLEGMLFDIQDNLYVLAVVDSIDCGVDRVLKYALINIQSFNRWTDAKIIGELCDSLKENCATYLGKLGSLDSYVRGIEKDTSLIEDINKSKLRDCREVADSIDINTSFNAVFE